MSRDPLWYRVFVMAAFLFAVAVLVGMIVYAVRLIV